MSEKIHKRVAFFLENLSGGGAERNMVSMANYLSENSYEIQMVLTRGEGAFLGSLSPEIRLVDLNNRTPYTSFPSLRKYLLSFKPEMLITTLDLINLIALITSRTIRSRPRILIRIANSVSLQYRPRYKKILERILMSYIYPLADEIIAVSRGVANDLENYAKINREKIRVIYSPVITPNLMTKRSVPLDHQWFQPGKPPVIVGVGRLNQQKNFPRLLRTFAQVRKEVESRLIILGEGEQRLQLESLIIELGLKDCVQLPGFVENPYPYLKNAGAFVLSSDYEGLPTALIEALACGCPVVATDCPSGPDEILAGGKYGKLVPLGDDDALVQAILRVLGGQVEKVPEKWLRQFHIDSFFKEFMGIINNLSPKRTNLNRLRN
jgi:glycosyltransferase involved in cell wall biosynthesis